MLRLRFKRIGRRKLPSYKIVIISSRKRREGKPILEVGFYNPLTKKIRIDSGVVIHRLSQGMQITRAVKSVLKKFKIALY